MKWRGRPSYARCMRMAAFPFNRPTACATLYLGGMLRHQCPWAGMACPSTHSTTHWAAEFPQALANILAERAKDCFVPILRYDDKGGIGNTTGQGLGFAMRALWFLLLVALAGPQREQPHSSSRINAGTAEPFRVSPPEAVAYLLELSFERSFGDTIVPERTEPHFFSIHAKRRDGEDTSGSPLAYPQSSFYYCRGVH